MKLNALLLIIFITFCVHSNSQIVINEYVSSNLTGTVDEDNDNEDWIEIYNAGDTQINLLNYALTDDITIPLKWQFPAVTIDAKSYQLIYASGKDRKTLPLSWQTIISQGDTWSYQVPSSNIGTQWREPAYDASSWTTGSSGFGYGDGDDATTIANGSLSVFLRKEFQITDASIVAAIILHLDYDDGFVAYVNGIEIARSNLGDVGADIAYNTTTSRDHEAVLYQGGAPELFVAENVNGLLTTGNNVIAIQVHNISNTSSDFSAIPFLTLAINDGGGTVDVPDFFTPPSNTLHANFKISKEGEDIYLFSPSGQQLDKVDSLEISPDVSYGRKADGTDNWFYFANPTPNASNSTMGVTAICYDSVMFSSVGGYHSAGLMLQLSSNVVGDKIYFTTDGSMPTESSNLYNTDLSITDNTVVRARIFRTNNLPGPIVTNTYLVRQPHEFPVISISTNPANLWDYNTGIYELGPNAEQANPHYGANFWQDWEKAVHIEYFDKDGIKQLDQGAGIKIFGGWTRANAQKSVALFARKEYGKGAFKYKLFDEREYDKFESIVLRNSGNDWDQTMFRDGFITGFADDMNVDKQAFEPGIVYLNGAYWGIQNIREKVNEDFLETLHHVEKDEINILEANAHIVEGSNDEYVNIMGFIQNADLQNADIYNAILKKLDVENYIQFHLLQTFIDNRDWPGNNIKFWKANANEGKWRWILYDTDFGFGLYEPEGYSYNTLSYALNPNGPSWPNPPWSTQLLRRLITSTTFRHNYANQFADHLNTTFLTASVNDEIDAMRDLYDGEIQEHLARWSKYYSSWSNEVDRLKVFSNYRPTYMWGFIEDEFDFSGRLSISIDVNDSSMGEVHLNSITVKEFPFSGSYFTDVPIVLTALPKPGYKFENWSGGVSSSDAAITYNMSTANSFTATFVAATANDISVVINEINYKSSETLNTGDWVEIYNSGVSTVDISNWQLTDLGADGGYIFPEGTILYPDEYLVICNELVDFKTNHPSISNAVGEFSFGLSSAGDALLLYDSNDNLIDEVNYLPSTPWPAEANGTGATLELVSPTYNNLVAGSWKSYANGGTPGRQNYNYIIDNISPVNDSEGNLLFSCYPNPFKDYTTVEMELEHTSHCKVDVIDVNGRIVRVLVNEQLSPNTYYFNWNGLGESSKQMYEGLYLIRLTSGSYIKMIKVIKLN